MLVINALTQSLRGDFLWEGDWTKYSQITCLILRLITTADADNVHCTFPINESLKEKK